MLGRFSKTQTNQGSAARSALQAQIAMWVVWTLYVVGFAFAHWYFAITAHHSEPIVGLAVHTLLAGLIGLIVMTWIEMRLNPERFTD